MKRILIALAVVLTLAGIVFALAARDARQQAREHLRELDAVRADAEAERARLVQ